MPTAKEYLPVFLDMGDALLGSGAEIFRVEDTLNRMGYACGATQMNVFVITSSIVVTMEFPGDGARTQTRRIRENGGNDFTRLEQLNDLSRTGAEAGPDQSRQTAAASESGGKYSGSLQLRPFLPGKHPGCRNCQSGCHTDLEFPAVSPSGVHERSYLPVRRILSFRLCDLRGCPSFSRASYGQNYDRGHYASDSRTDVHQCHSGCSHRRHPVRHHPADCGSASCRSTGAGIYGRNSFIWEVWTLNTQAIIQLITGAVGSVAFGMLFHMKSKYLPLAGAGGFLSWLVFLIGKTIWGSVFLPTLLAGFIADLYAEILARICKETSTSFFVTSVIPLIPGSTLYYCMNSIMEGNTMQALAYGRDTFLFAFGIAAGMSIGWAICYFFRTVKSK